MFNHLRCGLLLALAYTAVAHASGKHEPWRNVEKLKPGDYVVVRVAGQQRLEDCTLLSADDSVLTCQRERDPNANWDAASNARLIFPRAAVASVWLLQEAKDKHLGRWIAIGLSAAFLTAEIVSSGAVGALFAGAVLYLRMDRLVPPEPAIPYFICRKSRSSPGSTLASSCHVSSFNLHRNPVAHTAAITAYHTSIKSLRRPSHNTQKAASPANTASTFRIS